MNSHYTDLSDPPSFSPPAEARPGAVKPVSECVVGVEGVEAINISDGLWRVEGLVMEIR